MRPTIVLWSRIISTTFEPPYFHNTIVMLEGYYSIVCCNTVPATGNVKMKCVQTRLVAKLKHVCIHHAQVMVGTVKRSKHDFY